MQVSKETDFKITRAIRKEIVKIIDERIRESHVTKEDFSELKGIVKELAEAQKRTEQRVEELAEAQKRTEIELKKLTAEVKGLTKGLKDTRGEVGGLSRTLGYAFENEAYRYLPKVLQERYGITIKERFVREEIGGREVNIFGRGEKNGEEVLVIGEAKLRLDERRKEREERDVFGELEDKVKAVREEYNGAGIVKVLVTHYATKGFLKLAKERGVIVVQSFEW